MPLITASDLSVSFAELDVFEGISLEVSERARVGIVGPNGQGKTTLLETLVGDIAPRSGSVRRNRGLSIGYVPQTTRHMDRRDTWGRGDEGLCRDHAHRGRDRPERR